MDPFRLIEVVKTFPALYQKNKGKGTGTSVEAKNAIWIKIAKTMNSTPDATKAKWRNLRDSYQKNIKWKEELTKRKMLEVYQEYKYADAMSFLTIAPKRRKRIENSSQDNAKKFKLEESYEQESDSHETEEYLIEFTNDSQASQACEEIQYEAETSNDERTDEVNITNTNQEDFNINFEEVEPEIRTIPNLEKSSSTITELDHWLDGIKRTMLMLPPIFRAKAKKKINDLVSDFEISYLESLDNENLKK